MSDKPIDMLLFCPSQLPGSIAAVLEEFEQIEDDDRYHVYFKNGIASARQKLLSALRRIPNTCEAQKLKVRCDELEVENERLIAQTECLQLEITDTEHD